VENDVAGVISQALEPGEVCRHARVREHHRGGPELADDDDAGGA